MGCIIRIEELEERDMLSRARMRLVVVVVFSNKINKVRKVASAKSDFPT